VRLGVNLTSVIADDAATTDDVSDADDDDDADEVGC